MLRKEGPQEWFHEENKDISAMQFQFKDKGSPLDYVYRLSSQMIVSYILKKCYIFLYNMLCLVIQIGRCIDCRLFNTRVETRFNSRFIILL